MRGDQLARQLQVTHPIEARPNGLTMAEIAARDGHIALMKALKKPIPNTGIGFFVINESGLSKQVMSSRNLFFASRATGPLLKRNGP